MAFRPKFNTEGKTVELPMSTGETIVKGDALVADSDGYYIAAGAATAVPVTHVAMETVTTTADGQLVLAVRAQDGVFEADCDAAASITDQGTYVDLATKATVNPDASTNDIFFLEKVIGAAETSTVVQGWFNHGVPLS